METEFNKRAESVYYVKFLTESLFYFAFSKLSRNIGVCSFRLCVIETRVWLYFMYVLLKRRAVGQNVLMNKNPSAVVI